MTRESSKNGAARPLILAMSSVPLALSSVATPVVSFFTTVSFHLIVCAQSICGGAVSLMPMSSEWLSLSNILAAWMTAFEGMQPTFRQTPPVAPFSMTMVFTPSCPRRMPAG